MTSITPTVQPKPQNRVLTMLRNVALNHGFLIVLAVVVTYYSFATERFLSLDNFLSLLHAAAPMMVVASGLALVVISGKLDISVGSIALLSVSVGALLMSRHDVHPVLASLVIMGIGAGLGALNGFMVVVLRINPLIATLGAMIALRGVTLEITRSNLIGLPEGVRRLGNLTIGPIFVDVIIALVIVVIIFLIHTRTPFGRQLVAIGNDEEVAGRLGVRIGRVTFLSFVISGLLASIGGLMSTIQVGTASSVIGSGWEFTAIATIVIGGISLFGGEGSIIPGVLRGVLILEIIRNGLNHLGADPYIYRFVNGGVIFLAMYADSLRARLPMPTLTTDRDTPQSEKAQL